MRISASSALLALALFGTAAIQGVTAQGPDPADWYGTFNVFGVLDTDAPLIAGANAPRCDPADITKVTSTENDKITGDLLPLADETGLGEIIDGCQTIWSKIKGSRRERGSLHNAPLYTDCDSTKVSTRGTGFDVDNNNATISATTTLVGEEARAAWSYSATVANRRTGFSAPAAAVVNQYYDGTTAEKEVFSAHGMCPKVTAAVTNSVNLTCSVSTSITQSVADFIYQIGNPTSSDFRGIKAVLTFGKNVTVRRMYLPRGSARVQLPSIVGNRTAKAGDALLTTSVTIPLVSRNLPSLGLLIGQLSWQDVDQGTSPADSSDVKLVVTRGRTVVCEFPAPSR